MLGAFEDAGVDSIVVGGLAATVHGSARLTQDVDLVYSREPRNIERLALALQPHSPCLRGAPPWLSFEWTGANHRRGLNFPRLPPAQPFIGIALRQRLSNSLWNFRRF